MPKEIKDETMSLLKEKVMERYSNMPTEEMASEMHMDIESIVLLAFENHVENLSAEQLIKML